MNEEQAQDALSAFRHHRHDVINFLQVMRAYTQLGRVEQAVETLDFLAEWLKSLSVLQNSIKPEDQDLVWHAATCPHVLLSSAPKLSLGEQRVELQEIWSSINAFAAELGVRAFSLEIAETVYSTRPKAAYILSVRPTSSLAGGWQKALRQALPQGLSDRFEIQLQSEN